MIYVDKLEVLHFCPAKKYQPNCSTKIGDACQPDKIVTQSNGCGEAKTIDTRLVHLPPCQMIRYKPVPLPPPMKIDHC